MKIVIKLGKTPLQPIHRDILRRSIEQAKELDAGLEDTRADELCVSNKPDYIVDEFGIPCSDIKDAKKPKIIDYTEDGQPVFEQVYLGNDKETGEAIYGIQPTVKFSPNKHDHIIVIGGIDEFSQKTIDRSNTLVLTY